VERNGVDLGVYSPAKFIYKRSPGSPTTEVAMRRSFRDDLYLVVGMVSPETKRASLQIHVNPLVSWIWTGVLVLILGAAVSLWPEMSEREVGAWAYVRLAAAGLSGVALSLWLGMSPTTAYATTRTLHPPPSDAVSWVDAPLPEGPLGLAGAALVVGGLSGIFFARRRG
jgi:cytochrome c-type biogenesis protein CcmF